MKYFKFSSVELQNQKVINQGEFIYYTHATPNKEEMKSIVKHHFDSYNKEISLHNIQEIDKDEFVLLATDIEESNAISPN
jgi:hypothetical protein